MDTKPPSDSGAGRSEDGTEALVNRLYREHRDELCRYIAKKFGCAANEAEDVVQSAFARFAAMGAPHRVENPRAFLYTTSYNIAVDLKRRHRVQANYVQAQAQIQADSDAGAVDTLGPERRLEGRQRLGIITRALWGMPQKRRQLLIMSRFDGLSYAEIARRVGLSETVVRKHVSNALADCQKALQKSASRDAAVAERGVSENTLQDVGKS